MDRRHFIKLGTLSSVFTMTGCATGSKIFCGCGNNDMKMLFAPRVGMATFRNMAGKDTIKRLEFFRKQGFRGVEGVAWIGHNRSFTQKEIDSHKAIGAKVKELGLVMGPQSSMNEKDVPTMTANKTLDGKQSKVAIQDMLKRQLETTFGVLERVGGKTFIIGPGAVDKVLPWDKQYENVIENMKFCAEICKKSGFVMEIEPLNTISHPGVFCDRAELGARICKDVNMPSCRLLYDVFHEYMQLKNVDTLDNPEVFKYIESFHVADAPARNEPGSGEIDYNTVFKKIWDKGFRGIIGLEHKQSKPTWECEEQMLAKYRAYDALV